MAANESERDLNAAIPEALWDALDAISGDFRLYKKKHLVAAALTVFLRMTPQQQYDAIMAAEQTYYRKATPPKAGETTPPPPQGANPKSKTTNSKR